MSIPFSFNPLGLSRGGTKTPLTLTFESSGDFAIYFRNVNDTSTVDLKYNLNGGGWKSLNIQTSYYDTLSVKDGDILQLQNFTENFSTSYRYYINILNSPFFRASGNIQSLVNYAQLPGLFNSFFQNSNVTDASQLLLPAETLSDSCYASMFYGCTSLTKAPALPAETLANSCYDSMFYGCTSLAKAPEILAENDYNVANAFQDMFRDCSSLSYIKVHLISIQDSNNFLLWADGVSSSGEFYIPSGASSSVSNIKPDGWTVNYF